MSYKLKVEWEHGDADFRTQETYKIKKDDLPRVLDFFFDLREWRTDEGHENLGFWQDGYHQHIQEFTEKVLDKHGDDFAQYLEYDKHYGNGDHRASLNKIWLKDGKKTKYIVWTKLLPENPVTLPEIGSEITLTSGQVDGYAKDTFGGSHEDYIGYHEFEEMGLGAIPNTDGTKYENYHKFTGVVKDIKIRYDKKSLKDYRNEFEYFHYIILVEYKGNLLSTSVSGISDKIDYKKDFLYLH